MIIMQTTYLAKSPPPGSFTILQRLPLRNSSFVRDFGRIASRSFQSPRRTLSSTSRLPRSTSRFEFLREVRADLSVDKVEVREPIGDYYFEKVNVN